MPSKDFILSNCQKWKENHRFSINKFIFPLLGEGGIEEDLRKHQFSEKNYLFIKFNCWLNWNQFGQEKYSKNKEIDKIITAGKRATKITQYCMREILLFHFYFSKTFHITWINLVYQNFLKNIQKQRRKGIASERVFIEGKTLFGK